MGSIRTHANSLGIIPACAVLAVFALACTAGTAHAGSSASSSPVSQLSIAGNGQVIARGATVTGVEGGVIYASIGWGAARIPVKIETRGTTRFAPRETSTIALKTLRKGHLIDFSGTLDSSASALKIVAASITNASFVKTQTVLEGTVGEVDMEAGEIALKTQQGEVRVAAGPRTVVTKAGDPVVLREIRSGTSVRATGTLNTLTKTLAADRIVLAAPEPPLGGGLLGAVLAWIAGRAAHASSSK